MSQNARPRKAPESNRGGDAAGPAPAGQPTRLSPTPATLLYLQTALGNQATSRFVARPSVRRGLLALQRDPPGGPPPTLPKPQVNLAVWAALIEVFEGAAHGGSWSEFADFLSEAAIRTSGTTADSQRKEIRRRAQWIASLQAVGPPPQQKVYSIPEALSALEALHAKTSGIDGLQASFGLRNIARLMARESAGYLTETSAAGHDPAPPTSLTEWLDATVDSLSQGDTLLMVELEGTLAKLAEIRGAFELPKDREERQRLGAEIGVLSRRALLLDDAARRTRGPNGALMTAVGNALGTINGIQAKAATESSSMGALGGGLELLAGHQVDLSASPIGDLPPKQVIDPEEAFPQAVDQADDRFQGQLAGRIEGLASQAATLRGKVIPTGFGLPDLAAAHQRWWAFYSQEQEKLDATGSVAWKLFEDFYTNAFGRDTGDPWISVEQGIGRGLLMPGIARAVGGGRSRDFAAQLDSGGPHRAERTTGTAQSAGYEFAEMMDQGPGGTAAGEESSRQRLSQTRRNQTSAAMSAAAALDKSLQPAIARGAGMAPDAGLPLVNVRATTPQEGWSYLVDVRDRTQLMTTEPPLVAREHKVVPPEVVEYLLARRQQIATLQNTHTPRAPGGQAIGGPRIPGAAGGAIEAGTGMAAETYIHGESTVDSRGRTALDPTARRLQTAISAGLTETGAEPGPGDPAARAMQLLTRELEDYLNRWMVENRVPAARVAAVIAIAQTEHGIKDSFKSFLNAKDFVEMTAKAIAIAGSLAVLGMLGPLGRIAALVVGSYLQAQGVSNITAVISIGAYLKQVSDEASDLQSARGWALITKGVATDLAAVMENVVTLPFTEGIAHLAESPPKNSRGLFDIVRPMVENDPKARQQMLDAVNKEITDFDLKNGGKQSHPDREALVALRDELTNQSTREGALGEEQTLHPDKPAPKGYELLTGPRAGRTAKEWKAMYAALGDHAVLITENSHLKGTTVQVRYDEGGVTRVEVAPDASPHHVADHAATVRELRKYEGTMGRVRQLGSNILTALRITPGFGRKGFEARAEVRKLRAIQERLRAKEAAVEKSLEHLSDDPSSARKELDAIQHELRSVEAQLKGWEGQVDSFAEGRGIIAAVGSQAPPGYAIVQVTPVRIKGQGWTGFPDRVPPKTVLEFPDGSRVWRTDRGIAIESDVAHGPGRAGYEREHPARSQYADPGFRQALYELAHSQGQGTGHESPYAIKLAPWEVNQRLQRHGIEEYLYRLRDQHPDVDFHLVTHTEGVPLSRRMQSIEYSIWVTHEGKRQRLFEFEIVVEGTIGDPKIQLPPDSVWVNTDPKLAPYVSHIDMSDVHDRFEAVDLSTAQNARQRTP